jgi:uncharacterized membrane protein YdjX (TVP38/TMEM64 family)
MPEEHRKHLPRILKEFHYPKTFLLIFCIILAYFIFKNPSVNSWINNLDSLSYFGSFIAGILLAFGFSAPIAVGFFITLKTGNLILTAIIGGLGALLADLIIFNIVKITFNDELRRIRKTRIMKEIEKILEKDLGKKLEHYLLYAFAGILIATPLPDEVGVSMLAGLTHIKQKILAIISFILHTIGIFIILLLST